MASTDSLRESQRRLEDAFDRVVAGTAGATNRTSGDAVAELSRTLSDTGGGVPESIRRIQTQLEQLSGIHQAQLTSLKENTQAVTQNTVVQASSEGRSAIGTAGRTAASVLGSGLFLSPLITGIAKLFGGGRSNEPAAPLAVFQPPAPLRVDLASVNGGRQVSGYDYTDQGAPRVHPVARTTPSTSITVNVHAMDSRSFLDHSEEIGRAVREAVLNSHALNGVLSEL